MGLVELKIRICFGSQSSLAGFRADFLHGATFRRFQWCCCCRSLSLIIHETQSLLFLGQDFPLKTSPRVHRSGRLWPHPHDTPDCEDRPPEPNVVARGGRGAWSRRRRATEGHRQPSHYVNPAPLCLTSTNTPLCICKSPERRCAHKTPLVRAVTPAPAGWPLPPQKRRLGLFFGVKSAKRQKDFPDQL